MKSQLKLESKIHSRFRVWRAIEPFARACRCAHGVWLAGVLHSGGLTGARLLPQNAAFFVIRVLAGPGVWQHPTLSRLHLVKDALEHRKTRVAARGPRHPAPLLTDDMCGLEYHLLHHRLDTAQRRLSHRAVALLQYVLVHDTHQVDRRLRQGAHQMVGDELFQGRAAQVYAGLELRVEPLMRGVVEVQINNLSIADLWSKRGFPVFQRIFGQQQDVASFVDCALAQPVNTAQRLAALVVQRNGRERFASNALAFDFSQPRPDGGLIGVALCDDLLHRCRAQVPLDEQINLAAQSGDLLQRLRSHVLRTKARVGAQMQARAAHCTGRAQGSLEVVFAHSGTMFAARAQIELQTITACVQVLSNGAVARHVGVNQGHAFCGRVALVHHKVVDVQRQVPNAQGAKVYRRAAHVQNQTMRLIRAVSSLHSVPMASKHWERKPSVTSKSFSPKVSMPPKVHLRMLLLAMPPCTALTRYQRSTMAGRLMRLNKSTTKTNSPRLLKS